MAYYPTAPMPVGWNPTETGGHGKVLDEVRATQDKGGYTPGAWRFPKITTPATPPAGETSVYVKADGSMYVLDDNGVEKVVAGGGGSAVERVYHISNYGGERANTPTAGVLNAAALDQAHAAMQAGGKGTVEMYDGFWALGASTATGAGGKVRWYDGTSLRAAGKNGSTRILLRDTTAGFQFGDNETAGTRLGIIQNFTIDANHIADRPFVVMRGSNYVMKNIEINSANNVAGTLKGYGLLVQETQNCQFENFLVADCYAGVTLDGAPKNIMFIGFTVNECDIRWWFRHHVAHHAGGNHLMPDHIQVIGGLTEAEGITGPDNYAILFEAGSDVAFHMTTLNSNAAGTIIKMQKPDVPFDPNSKLSDLTIWGSKLSGGQGGTGILIGAACTLNLLGPGAIQGSDLIFQVNHAAARINREVIFSLPSNAQLFASTVPGLTAGQIITTHGERGITTTNTATTLTVDAMATQLANVNALTTPLTVENPLNPRDGQEIWLSLKSQAVQALTFGSAFAGTVAVPLPTATPGINARQLLGFRYVLGESNWRCIFNSAQAASGGSGSTTLAGLTDVTITSPVDGQVLKRSGSGWVNGTDNTGSSGGPAAVNVVTTPGATETLSSDTHGMHVLTLNANCTVTLTGSVGTDMLVVIKQPASGGPYTVTWVGADWPGGQQPTLTQAANGRDVFTFAKYETGDFVTAGYDVK